MTNVLGPYYSPWHWRGEDETYMRRLDPAWVLIHQPSARAIEQVQRVAPNAKIMLRSWDIDDHNGDRKREMYADPKRAARTHLSMWRDLRAQLVAELQRNGWPAHQDRWFIQLVNEPDPNYVNQVGSYCKNAMEMVEGDSIHLGLIVSSVGTFAKPSESDYGWTQLVPLEKPIRDGGHIVVAHEYWQPEGPSYGEDGGNLAWRHRSIPLDVPILIGEAGANGYIYGRYSQEDDSGWQKTVKDPNVYAAQVREYIEGCDERVEGVLLYMLDYHSDQWWSFDTQPAMHQLLAIKDARPQIPSPFAQPAESGPTVYIPSIPGPTSVAKPEEPTVSDTWERSIAFVSRWEGEYQNIPNDAGNWTGGEVGKGELKGTKYGISAASYPHLDIVNLTREQAHEIYRRDYWQASGADKLPWPACLLVFDTAVLHGVGAATKWQREVGTNAYAFAAKRLRVYTQMHNWDYWGKAWTNRVADLLEAMGE